MIDTAGRANRCAEKHILSQVLLVIALGAVLSTGLACSSWEKAHAAMGIVETSDPQLTLQLVSDNGVFSLDAGKVKHEIPVGSYRISRIGLGHKDQTGTVWSLAGNAHALRAKTFDVTAGGTTRLDFGPPLAAIAKVGSPNRGWVSIGVEVKGKTGETYAAGVYRNGRRQAAPSFRIVSGEKVLVSGRFEYG